MNERAEVNGMREPLHKTRTFWKTAIGRATSVCSIEEFILRAKKKKKKKSTYVRLLGRFLKTKVEDRKVEGISAVQQNEYVSQFVISVYTKDGTETEYEQV